MHKRNQIRDKWKYENVFQWKADKTFPTNSPIWTFWINLKHDFSPPPRMRRVFINLRGLIKICVRSINWKYNIKVMKRKLWNKTAYKVFQRNMIWKCLFFGFDWNLCCDHLYKMATLMHMRNWDFAKVLNYLKRLLHFISRHWNCIFYIFACIFVTHMNILHYYALNKWRDISMRTGFCMILNEHCWNTCTYESFYANAIQSKGINNIYLNDIKRMQRKTKKCWKWILTGFAHFIVVTNTYIRYYIHLSILFCVLEILYAKNRRQESFPKYQQQQQQNLDLRSWRNRCLNSNTKS